MILSHAVAGFGCQIDNAHSLFFVCLCAESFLIVKRKIYGGLRVICIVRFSEMSESRFRVGLGAFAFVESQGDEEMGRRIVMVPGAQKPYECFAGIDVSDVKAIISHGLRGAVYGGGTEQAAIVITAMIVKSGENVLSLGMTLIGGFQIPCKRLVGVLPGAESVFIVPSHTCLRAWIAVFRHFEIKVESLFIKTEPAEAVGLGEHLFRFFRRQPMSVPAGHQLAGPSSTRAPVVGSKRALDGALLSVKSLGSRPKTTPACASATSSSAIF